MESVNGVQLNRTVGLELEGYVNENPRNFSMLGMDWHVDESLNHTRYDSGCDCYDEDDCDCGVDDGIYGVEYNTLPISNTEEIDKIYVELAKYDWSVDHKAGLHIHVDSSDFNIEEKAKLLRFGVGIEHVMYAIVESYRSDNDYCQKMHKGWRYLFRNKLGVTIDWDSLNALDDTGVAQYAWHSNKHMQYNALQRFLSENRSSIHNNVRDIWTGRYQWLNGMTSHDTVEFRLFSATDDVETAQRFALIAHNIVETVKYSTIEQLNFIIKSTYEQHSVEDMISTLMTSIGLEGLDVPILNSHKAQQIDEKFCAKNRGEGQEVIAV
jgi:hypothetical protein